MALFEPPRPTPYKPLHDHRSAPGPTWSSRWKGGGEPLRPIDVTLALGVPLAITVSLLVGGAYLFGEQVANYPNLSESMSVGPWQGGAVRVTVGPFPVETIQVSEVTVIVTDKTGDAYYLGEPDHTMWMGGSPVSVSYHDVDNDGLVSEGDWVSIVSNDPTPNPVAGGTVGFAFGPEGYAVIELP